MEAFYGSKKRGLFNGIYLHPYEEEPSRGGMGETVMIARFGASEEKERALQDKMTRLGIKEDDIVEHFVRSSGHGGQHVNKTSTCVYLRHSPTGIEVKCQQERSQALNRFLARRILVNKIENLVLGRESEERQRVERIKRQKRRRSRRAKEKVLEFKHHQSEKKKSRSFTPDGSDL
jgi:protein subunit release factor B